MLACVYTFVYIDITSQYPSLLFSSSSVRSLVPDQRASLITWTKVLVLSTKSSPCSTLPHYGRPLRSTPSTRRPEACHTSTPSTCTAESSSFHGSGS